VVGKEQLRRLITFVLTELGNLKCFIAAVMEVATNLVAEHQHQGGQFLTKNIRLTRALIV